MKVKDLLTDESKWCKGLFSTENKQGEWSYCILGAIYYCYNEQDYMICKIVRKHLNCRILSEWNDDPARTFQEVKSLVEELDI